MGRGKCAEPGYCFVNQHAFRMLHSSLPPHIWAVNGSGAPGLQHPASTQRLRPLTCSRGALREESAYLGSEGVVVAKAHLLHRHGVVLVDDWHSAIRKQLREGVACVQVLRPDAQIVLRQQHLRAWLRPANMRVRQVVESELVAAAMSRLSCISSTCAHGCDPWDTSVGGRWQDQRCTSPVHHECITGTSHFAASCC